MGDSSSTTGKPVALITGANRGIGLGLAQRWAHDGWQVIATAREPQSAEGLWSLKQDFPDLQIEQLDLGDSSSIAALVSTLAERPIDMLINNAGIFGRFPLVENISTQRFGTLDYEVWAEVMRVNCFGTVELTEALMPAIEASDRKTVITLSSAAGSIGGHQAPAIPYTSSKTALNKAMTTIARTVKDRGVLVAIVCPGHVRTRLGLGGGEIEVDESVSGLATLIGSFTIEDSGTFRRYNGDHLVW